MWLYILQGIGYGLAAAAQPGPLQTYLISQALTKGWKQTLPAAFAPLISDGPIVALSLFMISQLPSWLERFLYIAGDCSFSTWLPAPTDRGEISIRIFHLRG